MLATARTVYASTSSPRGAAGLGARSANVAGVGLGGGAGTLNVYQLLRTVDQRAVAGVPFNRDPVPQREANIPFAALNQTGSIG